MSSLRGPHLQQAGTLEVLGADDKKVLLVVVPHHFDPDIAHETMMAAAVPNDASTVDDLLMVSGPEKQAPIQAAVTESTWAAHD